MNRFGGLANPGSLVFMPVNLGNHSSQRLTTDRKSVSLASQRLAMAKPRPPKRDIRLNAVQLLVMRRGTQVLELPLPERLTRLIATGIWPSAAGPSMTAQQLKPLVPAERVRCFAPQESLICLQPPPFHTVAAEMAGCKTRDFWERFCRLDQIAPEKALIIGDFGLGSDAAIILDFARDAENPPVLSLRWGPERRNEWVQGARDFDEFAKLLGLTEGVA